MEVCRLCPRNCQVNREKVSGYCGMTNELKAARAGLHLWEEPCFTGTKGSGTVFFSGCGLHCVFCQNREIANGRAGVNLTKERLAEIFLELEEAGAHNINLVTAGHFAPAVAEALRIAKAAGLTLPILYNCGGYESLESLRCLDGLIDIYMPDFKFWEPETAERYARASDYRAVAKRTIAEMVRQIRRRNETHPVMKRAQGKEQELCVLDETGMMLRGVLVRHLILPGHVRESKAILQYLLETYGDAIYLSIMNQYTPMPGLAEAGYPELGRQVTKREHQRVMDYALELGLEKGFFQEGETAKESFIPLFDGYGISRE